MFTGVSRVVPDYEVRHNLLWRRDTDTLDEVTELDLDIPQEGAALPSSHDRDCFQVNFDQIYFHGKP